MRMMSFALTERQLLDGTKTVTRRTGWENLRPGERLIAVRKAMGLKAGEKVQALCEIEVVSVRREALEDITPAEVLAEGFPQWTNNVAEFVAMFCRHMTIAELVPVARVTEAGPWPVTDKVVRRKMTGTDPVTRIEFRKVPGSERIAVQQGAGAVTPAALAMGARLRVVREEQAGAASPHRPLAAYQHALL